MPGRRRSTRSTSTKRSSTHQTKGSKSTSASQRTTTTIPSSTPSLRTTTGSPTGAPTSPSTRSIPPTESFWELLKPLIVIFVILFLSNLNYLVESNPTRGTTDIGDGDTNRTIDTTQIVDTGFVLTSNFHKFFHTNQLAVDIGALLNTLLVIGCQAYAAYMSFWVGDHGLMFRILFAASLRGFCGWFTYLPASPEYLQSNYDFPDVLTSGALQQMLFHLSFPLTPSSTSVPPFVSFFSGHVANTVMVANFTYLRRGHARWGKFIHFLNILQVVRLLSTRGHYSIDIIVGWIVAVYVCSPAEKLGSYFSNASVNEIQNSVHYWATEKAWGSELMYVEVNGVGGITRSDQQKTPLRQLVSRTTKNMSEQSKRGRKNASLYLQNFVEQRNQQLRNFKEACVDRGIVLPNLYESRMAPYMPDKNTFGL